MRYSFSMMSQVYRRTYKIRFSDCSSDLFRYQQTEKLTNDIRKISTYRTMQYKQCKLQVSLLLTNSLRCMAGHSKWQNIKHIKAEKDKAKSLACNRFARLVALAVRENGADPKLNNKLANLLEEAKKNNIPSSTVENAFKKAERKKTMFGTIEMVGPGGCLIIMEYETDNVSTTRHGIKLLCKKYGVNILSGEGRWRAVYEKKGFIKAVSHLDGQPCDAEKSLDAAIEAGAEEVQLKEDDDGGNFLEFLCDPSDLLKVKKELERTYELEEAYIGYRTLSTIQLSANDMKVADDFLLELGDMQDIVRIYENVQ